MKKTKEQKGITLISLVITIIILLILALVAINLAVDSNGLFKKTGDVANAWNTSVADEKDAMGELLDTLESISPTEITLSTDFPEGWNTSAVSQVATAGNRQAPIPTGFVASSVAGENTISGGLVIYQTGNADTTADGFWMDTDENGNLVCQTTYNQYVWIPVDNINDMIMCQSKTASDTCNIEIQADGSLKCTTHNSTKLAGKLYWDEENLEFDANATEQTYDTNSGLREPAVVTGNSTGDGTSYDGATDNYHGLESTTAFLEQLQDDFDRMAQSVAKYKGFYISRYEVGTGGASIKGQTVLNNGSSSANMWYGLYNTLRSDPNTIASTYSQMIWRKPV